jgi:hypothetical protein
LSAAYLSGPIFAPKQHLVQYKGLSSRGSEESKGIGLRGRVVRDLKENVRLSAGMGISLMHRTGRLEFLYNFFHRCKASDFNSAFQARISVNE